VPFVAAHRLGARRPHHRRQPDASSRPLDRDRRRRRTALRSPGSCSQPGRRSFPGGTLAAVMARARKSNDAESESVSECLPR
jgi:hypothetical protein